MSTIEPTDAAADDFESIAIIGMSGRFPGARTIDEFWKHLCAGVESIASLSDAEILASGQDPQLLQSPDLIKASPVLDHIDLFDAGFFGYTPKEAALMDPQQRIFLECAWEALESAGYNPDRYPGWIGVYGGAGFNGYLLSNLVPSQSLRDPNHSLLLLTANDRDYVTTRISYKLNLKGPSVNIQTACSTSLVAVHLACQALLNYQCDMALAGGTSVRVPHKSGYLASEGGMDSRDGHVRVFDARASGTVFGSGVGLVVLKRLSEALEDGDQVYAVIRGSAINNDGALKVGFTAPSIEGQMEVLRLAQGTARVAPDTIGYVEAHGTATPLGDPIEVAALTNLFRESTQARGFCAIGSVKSNIGHASAAAGIMGLIKTVLALTHRQIPPTLHFEQPNPRIDFASSPFYVTTALIDWPAGPTPRRAGVSSFGVGGTNAHAVLEEAPAVAPSGPSRPWQLLLLSAKSESALERMSTNLAGWLASSPDVNLADVAFTLQAGRKAFNHRRMLVCRDVDDAIDALEARAPQRLLSSQHATADRPIVLMCSGLGDHYVQMGRGLYETEAVFRAAVDRCCDRLLPLLGIDLGAVLYPGAPPADTATAPSVDFRRMVRGEPSSAELLQQTALAQPALFVVEYALAQLLMSWGIQPQALIGYSLGEYVAACLAGVFSLEDALYLVAKRAQLIQRLPSGTMLAVSLPEAELRARLDSQLALAAINGDNLCVASGPTEAISALEQRLHAESIACRRVPTSHAFHSPMMEPIVGPFRELFERIRLQPPTIPYLSNVTGTWITAAEATDPDYWAAHLCQTVRFADGLAALRDLPGPILLEVGPGQTLSSLVHLQAPDADRTEWLALPSLRAVYERGSDLAFALGTLGQLWLAGLEIDWTAFSEHEQRRRIALPTYPFERQRYWIDPPTRAADSAPQEPTAKRAAIADWFYAPLWRQTIAPPGISDAGLPDPAADWLIFSDGAAISTGLVAQLRRAGQAVRVIQIGQAFAQVDAATFTINPYLQDDYTRLIETLSVGDRRPAHVIHLWGLTSGGEQEGDLDFERAQFAGLYSLIFLAQALHAASAAARVDLRVITSGLFQIAYSDRCAPANATVLGACRVIPQEYPHLACAVVDLLPAAPPPSALLLAECCLPTPPPVVAYRAAQRWYLDYEPQPIPAPPDAGLGLRSGGVYLVTHALDDLGHAVATAVAQQGAGTLVLPYPPTTSPERLATAVAALEPSGGAILPVAVDLTDAQQIETLRAMILKQCGALHGVIYVPDRHALATLRWLSQTTPASAHPLLSHLRQEVTTLHAALRDLPLDVWQVHSSLATVLGGPGLATYAAAQSWLTAYAQQQRQAGADWRCVRWDIWQTEEREGVDAVAALGIRRAEGIAASVRTWHTSIGDLLVATADLSARLRQWTSPAQIAASTTATAGRHARPDLPTAYVAPGDEIEARVAAIWQDVLGIERVGVHDPFFQLGGHSLLGTQLVARLCAAFQVDLPLRALLEGPTIAEVARAIEAIRSAEAASLAEPAILERRGAVIAPPSGQTIPRSPRAGTIPLSFAQQRMWLLDQLMPDQLAYIIPTVMRLAGALDVDALAWSLAQVVRRHEVLRTTFALDPDTGQPTQVIAPDLGLDLPLRDLRATPDRAPDVARSLIRQPFDLGRGPLLRATLLRLAEAEHWLVLTLHHSVADGWSLEVLVREVATLYALRCRGLSEAAGAGLGPLGTPLPIQYADYAVWQRAWLHGEVGAQQLDYWRRQLAGVPPIELPIDRPRPAVASAHGALHPFHLPATLRADLNHLSQREGATLFMTLLAAWQMLLARYTGQTDIAVGTPIAGRVRPELEGLIGLFVNTLVLRTDLAGAPTFVDLVARVRAVCLDAYTHQDLPFDVVVEHLHPTRDLSRHPLFQVLFVLQNLPTTTIALPDLTVEPVRVETGTAKFDLAMLLSETADGLRGEVEYATDLFDAGTIERLVGHYQLLLTQIVADPTQPIMAVPLLDDAERRQLLVDWNRTACPGIAHLRVHQLVEAQAARTPDALAVTDGQRTLTYAAFDRRANQLAHVLRAYGVGPDVCVALALDRSVELAVAVLAVLKAGGAYLPLDPAYPGDRLRFMIADSATPVLVTQTTLVDRLPATAARIMTMDTLTALDHAPTMPPTVEILDEHLAYVLYTSGSTGMPKAVAMPHRALVNLLAWQRRSTTVAPAATTLQFAALSFDVSFQEMFATWASGGTLRLIAEDERRDLAALLALLATGRVQRVFLPFIALQHLAEVAVQQQALLSGVQEIVTAGEQLQITPAIAQVCRQISAVSLHNQYGPTETHVVTAHVLDGDPATWPALPPIGRPIANTTIYVLDTRGAPVPIGVAGDVYIGGVPLARGYLHQPSATAERFVPDPFSGTAGARLYRTGDRARYLPDGTIDYLGRIDQQVKVRGFRVELGEVETALRRHPAVLDTAVTVREDTPGDRRLCAYVVPRPGQSPEAPDLRLFLQQILPDYMIPRVVMLMEALPLTPSGKVDRRALPPPDAASAMSDASQVAPRDDWEWRLAQLWADLLHLPAVSVHDDFFALGGHSLLAVQVMTGIRQHFGCSLPLATLVQSPTIAQLAAHLRQNAPEPVWSPLVPLQPRGSRRPFFCIHPGGGTVFCYADLARALGPDQPCYGLQAQGLEAGQTPHRSIPDLAAAYITAIRLVQPHGPYLLGGWSLGGVIAFEIASQFQHQGEAIGLLVLIDSAVPLPDQAPPDDALLMVGFAHDLGGLLGTPLTIDPDDLAMLTPNERLSYILEQARQQQVLPPDSNLEQLRRLADVFTSNLAAMRSYQPTPTSVPIAMLEAGRAARPGEANTLADRWRPLGNLVEHHVVPGTHDTLLRPPQVQAVAEWLRRQLDVAQAEV
ncbi:MAG TPA: amino acid adenylation domain-containing protein [Herpetosiphonaceae bacterium]